MCKSEALTILKECYTEYSNILPCTIQEAYLYGSYARGDYHEESDVDIILSVDMDWEELEPYRRDFAHIGSKLSLKHDVTVSVSITPLSLFKRFDDLPYYRNIRTEGIRYVA